MDMDIVVAAVFVTGLASVLCGSGLLGWRMWLRSKTERLKLAPPVEIERLGEAMDALHERMQFVQEEMAELHERVDFAERLLARGASAEPEDSLRSASSMM